MTLAQGAFGTSRELEACLVASTSNIAGSYFNGPTGNGINATLTTTSQTLTVDGVLLQLFDRVLLASQTDTAQNGIYFVAVLSPGLSNVVLQRAQDMQTIEQLKSGQFFTIESGTASAGSLYITTVPAYFVFGLSTIVFNSVDTNPSGIVPLSEGGTGANLTSNADGGIIFNKGTEFDISAAPTVAHQFLQSGAGDTPNWTPSTFPDTASTAGKVIISDGTNYVNSTSIWPNTVGTVGKIVRSDGTVNTYTTSTFADTYGASTLLYSNGANTVTGLATANSASLVTNSSGVPAWSGTMTNGQVIIGSTGATPTAATLTAGPGVSISNGAASITISGTGSGIGWTEVVGTSQAMTADSGYVANNAGLVTFTLPATAAFGTAISIIGKGAGGWSIAQNALQVIQVGSSASTAGVPGSVSSTNQFDSIDLICTTANLVWTTLGGPQGVLTVA